MHVFENIYLPAAQSGNPSIVYIKFLLNIEDGKFPKNNIFLIDTFNTTVDIKLRQWAEQQLPARSVESGWECLQQEFQKFMSQARLSSDHDDIFDNLKNAVVSEAMRRHSWEEKVNIIFRFVFIFSILFLIKKL